MSKKKFKKGDLVEYDFGYGIVIQTHPKPDQRAATSTEFCKVLWSDGVIDWISAPWLHDPSAWLKRRRVARDNK